MGRELSECTEKKANNWAKPSKVDKKKEKDAKTYIQHLADKERAFSAASRRGDRKGIEGRMKSAQQASAVHKLRTGRALKITEDIVLGDQMYEEEASPTAIFRSSHQISMHHQALPAVTYDGLAQHLRDNPAIKDNLVTLINIAHGQPMEEPTDPKMTMEMSLFIQTTQSLPSQQKLVEQLSHEQICTEDLARQLLTQQYHYQQLECRFQQLQRQLAEESIAQSTSGSFNEPLMSQVPTAGPGDSTPQNMPTPSMSRNSSSEQGMSSPLLNKCQVMGGPLSQRLDHSISQMPQAETQTFGNFEPVPLRRFLQERVTHPAIFNISLAHNGDDGFGQFPMAASKQ
ncbi:hypothetical protein EYC84_008885 [Monilinia fructicola]|uniref:Uncharacterized protein n=1 Tax=Monilinia fructicola TaxID=38448 RepID=A0A5M9JC22_MONFR|nr:hypothetical protein EYC84_008885 [Monilinia fructicola]